MIEMTTPQMLQSYIVAEMKDSALYREIAKVAPNDKDRELLLELSRDEQAHADEFKRLYRQMYGTAYNPEIPPPPPVSDFYGILHERLLDESHDFWKYARQYLDTRGNPSLKEAYYLAHIDENVHALRILYILSSSA